MKTRKTIASILTAWVGDRQLAEAADELGIGVSTLHYHVRGRYVPRDRQVRHIAPLLGWSIKALLAIAKRDRQLILSGKLKPTTMRKARVPRAKASAA